MDTLPDDLKAIAEQIVRDYGGDPKGLLIGAIAGALFAERERHKPKEIARQPFDVPEF